MCLRKFKEIAMMNGDSAKERDVHIICGGCSKEEEELAELVGCWQESYSVDVVLTVTTAATILSYY